jgi:hypothetical protein
VEVRAPSSAKGNLLLGIAYVAWGLIALAGCVWILGGWWSVPGAFLLWMALRRALPHLRKAWAAIR